MTAPKPSTPLLPKFLWFVMALFIGILIFVYVVTRRTNVVMLDEHGHATQSSGSTDPHR